MSGMGRRGNAHNCCLIERCHRQHNRGTCQSPAGSASYDAAASRRTKEVSFVSCSLLCTFKLTFQNFFTPDFLCV